MKDDRVYLGDIRDAINDIERCLSASHDVFVAERMREDAVIALVVVERALFGLEDDVGSRGRRPVDTAHAQWLT